MVRFVSSASSMRGKDKTENRAGGESFSMPPEKRLLNMAATCMFGEDKYYGGVEKQMQEALNETAKKDGKFPLQLAAYIRDELHLRTTPIALLVMAANNVNCKPYVRAYSPKIIKRADELCETIAAQFKMFDRTIPNSLKKGVADSFDSFNEYQLAKYSRASNIRLKDVIMLTHPKSPSELIKKILDEKLEIPKTWEVEISTKGSTKENWENVLPSLGYMALLRNCNNLLKVGVPVEKFIHILGDKDKVLRSKQLPFRFYSAMKSIHTTDPFAEKEVKNALELALEHSIENLPKLKGRTVIAVDTSGSMNKKISEKSIVTHRQISSLFGAMANRYSDNAVTYAFGATIQRIEMSGKILPDTEKIDKTDVGYETNGHLVLNDLLRNKIKADRIIFFTDEELWNTRYYDGKQCECTLRKSFLKYVTEINPNIMMYIVNVNGYGDTCISRHERNAMTINGFSDNVLKFIEVEENDQIAYIRNNY